MVVKPIRPEQVVPAKKAELPDAIFEAFNELIARNFNNGSAVVQQDAVADLIAAKAGVRVAFVFKNHWLDVEDLYREAGWKVVYDKPGFNESYQATFTFSRK